MGKTGFFPLKNRICEFGRETSPTDSVPVSCQIFLFFAGFIRLPTIWYPVGIIRHSVPVGTENSRPVFIRTTSTITRPYLFSLVPEARLAHTKSRARPRRERSSISIRDR